MFITRVNHSSEETLFNRALLYTCDYNNFYLMEYLISKGGDASTMKEAQKIKYVNYLKGKCLITKIKFLPLDLINEIQNCY